MRVLLATPLYSQHYDAGHFWLRALNQMGHTVTVWDFRLDKRPPPDNTDFTLILKGPNIDPWHMPIPSPRICYYPDAFDRTPGIAKILQHYERVYTPVRPTPEWATWLPTGFDSDIHRYTGAPRDIPSLYIGTFNSQRKQEYLSVIKPAVVAGNGWAGEFPLADVERDVFLLRPTILSPHYLHDFVALASRAQVAINIHQGPVGVNRKLFELIPSTFTITDRVPGVEEVLGDITDQVAFSTPEEGRAKVEHYLAHPEEREELWQIERQRIRPYTYDSAVAKILLGKLPWLQIGSLA